MAGLSLEVLSDPVPSVGVTVDGLDASGPSTVTVERSIPGEGWTQVPGMAGRQVTGGFYEVDYAAPLAVPVTYRATVVGAVQPATLEAVVTVVSGTCWLQDPVNPFTAVPVHVGSGARRGGAFFTKASFASLSWQLPGAVERVMGATTPVGMGGVRQAPSGLPMTIVTQSREQANRLRTLLTTAYPLMLRVVPPVTQFPAVSFLHAEVEERPRFDVAPFDGSREDWVLTADVVRAPRVRVLVPRWTYGDVQALWETHGQAVAAGGSYLDWLRDPTPAGRGGAAPMTMAVEG
ncbi:hypothetical protein [Georgenia thermotolerans]|uniref:hypothetical protein n=1 Tax=Georgenia thermotolerans TaxID=527326 RepID=UPI0012659DF2|nr:hypothetical protein [Georgenia thermotolerans]